MSRFVTPGIPDEDFAAKPTKTTLLTKMEARAVSLAKLRLTEDCLLWDIGAGAGSIAIEAALLARRGKVYAVEKDPEQIGYLRANIDRHNVDNVEVVEAEAPQGLERLPTPTRVFIGGSSGAIIQIVAYSATRLGKDGRIVINTITLENTYQAVQKLRDLNFGIEVTLLNVARSKRLASLLSFEALNPVYIIAAKRA